MIIPRFSIDTENYREKRAEALLALSTRLADKVTKTGKKFTLEPMNPYERRIIHSNLQDSETVTTYSVGSEPYRKVVIAPKNAKPYGKGGYKKDGYKKRGPKPHRNHSDKPVAEKTGSYTTTYKADFKLANSIRQNTRILKIILQVTVMNLKVKNKYKKLSHICGSFSC